MKASGRMVLAALAAVFLLGAAPPVGSASTLGVDCTANPAALGVALAAANDGDTLSIQGACHGTFDLSHSVTLTGSGGAVLDAQGAGTVLTIDPGKVVTVSDLTITGGSLTVPVNAAAAGIQNEGTLTLENSTVRNNDATVPHFRNGVGGILNFHAATLTLVNSTVSTNTATASESSNTTVGGIFNACCGSSVTLMNSTVAENRASSPSGAYAGILNSAPGDVVTLTNSTVSGNSAAATGGMAGFSIGVGGISNSGGTLTLTSSTLVGNEVSLPNGGFLPPVGGVSDFFGGSLTISNSLVAAQRGGPNCYGPESDAGYNLDDGTSCAFSSGNHSLSSADPLLDPAGLKDNGGPTQTIALMSGSSAIDAIPAGVSGCGTTIATDQRGVARPAGSGCDIGAFEFAVRTLTVAIDIKPGGVPNAINPDSNGVIPVAVLSTPSFDAPTQVDTASLAFGRTGNETSLAGCNAPQDANGDGLNDVLCRFTTQKTGFQSGDTEGVLTGKARDGTPIKGTDSVVIVPLG